MKFIKYILIFINIIEFNSAYSAIPKIDFGDSRDSRYSRYSRDSRYSRYSRYSNRNTERKADIVRNKCGLINNVTEYIFELCAIIDIMLPKK